METISHTFYIVVLVIMLFMLFSCLVRAIKGPRVADRLVAVNMMGTMVMVMIAVFSLLLGEGYLVDICLIYAMISFLSVVVLTKVYTGVYVQQKTEHKIVTDMSQMETMKTLERGDEENE